MRVCSDCGKKLSRNLTAQRCRSCCNRSRYKTRPMPTFRIDEKHKSEIMRHRWRKHTHGYITGRPFGKADSGWLLHQFVWFLETGQRAKNIDHINGDKTDCQISNLRLATNALQALNRPQIKTRLKLPTGVCRGSTRRSPYQAYIKRHGIRRYLGSFKTAIAASNCYQNAKEIVIEFEALHALQNQNCGENA